MKIKFSKVWSRAETSGEDSSVFFSSQPVGTWTHSAVLPSLLASFPSHLHQLTAALKCCHDDIPIWLPWWWHVRIQSFSTAPGHVRSHFYTESQFWGFSWEQTRKRGQLLLKISACRRWIVNRRIVKWDQCLVFNPDSELLVFSSWVELNCPSCSFIFHKELWSGTVACL